MTTLHKLSLPKSINDNDDSFSKDLLRQFDKRRSKLHVELGLISKEPSPESSTRDTSSIQQQHRDYSNLEPIQLDHDIEEYEQLETDSTGQKRSSYVSKRSSSASDLFRRSSAYLMSKLNMIKKNKSDDDHIIPITNKQQTKLLMKTTITVPSTATNNNNQQQHLDKVLANPIPVITQYPPKPLVYSPVEPIVDTTDKNKPLLHRISMPLLRVYQDTHSLSHNKSIASFVNRRRKSEPDQHTKRK